MVFESNQSYYNLFKEAGISWKKTQKKNPAKNDELVEVKRKEIEEFLAKWQPEIETGKLTVFMIDECHILWGDILGYAWGKTDERIEIAIKNEKERQTYYGALDYKTKEFLVQEYESGNTKNTIEFIKSNIIGIGLNALATIISDLRLVTSKISFCITSIFRSSF